MIATFGTEFRRNDIEDALKALCFAQPFDPACEYLDALDDTEKWDGTPRIGSWLSIYGKADANEYTKGTHRPPMFCRQNGLPDASGFNGKI
jgi:hypothetical protein